MSDLGTSGSRNGARLAWGAAIVDRLNDLREPSRSYRGVILILARRLGGPIATS